MIRTQTRATAHQKRTTARARGMLEPLEGRVQFAAGDLDPNFGSGGIATADFGNASVSGIDVASFGNKIYAAGVYTAPGSTQHRIALAAFDRAGRPDPSLGGDGTVVTDVPAENDEYTRGEMLVQSDGKIVVLTGLRHNVSPTERPFTVARFNPDGSPDTGFGGGNGHVELEFGRDLALSPGGKIVVSGTPATGGFAVARLNANGSLDTSFDGDGERLLDFGSGNDSGQNGAEDVAVLPDGKIVLVGAERADYFGPSDDGWYAAVARLNPDGSNDATFGDNGLDTWGYGYFDNGLSAVTTGPHGELVAGAMIGEIKAAPDVLTGSAVLPASTRFSTVDFSYATINRIHVMPDGKVVVAGDLDETRFDEAGPIKFLARYNPDGSFDPTFAGGHVTRATTDQTALTPEGDVLALVSPRYQPPGTFGVARYLGSDTDNRTTVIQPEDDRYPKSGVVAARDNAGYTGAGYADFVKDSGASLSADFAIHQSGNHELRFRYANGSRRARTLEVQVGGNTYRVAFLPTGSWTRWREARITVPITTRNPQIAELTRIELRTIGQNGPNVDKISVVRPASDPPSSGLIQAESGTIVGADVFSVNPGYTGSGYVDYRAPAGDSVRWLVSASGERSAQVKFRYANGSSAARPLELRVNGIVVNPALSFAPTGSWSSWQELTVPILLRYGTNTIQLASTGSNGPNLDSLTVS